MSRYPVKTGFEMPTQCVNMSVNNSVLMKDTVFLEPSSKYSTNAW